MAVTTVPYVWNIDSQFEATADGYEMLHNRNDGTLPWVLGAQNSVVAGTAFTSTLTPFWSNYDIINSTDNSVYLAASDSIPLDGMNVIEWDGDTTGLEKTAESTQSAPRYKVSDTIVPIDGDNYIVVSNSSGVTSVVSSIPTYYESGGYYWVGMRRTADVFWAVETTVSGTSPGVQFYSNGTNTYHSLFAYPIETTVDYTITYQTKHGTAPASKTVTVNTGESYTLTADDLPTLSRYDIGGKYIYFTAWATQQFHGERIGVGYEIDGNITLHAVWSLKHTITFHTEHGEVPEPLIVTAYSDYFFETRVAMADLPVLEADGYIFNGWSNTKDGSYIIGSGYFIGNDTNLYAVWEKVVEPEIAIYESNGEAWVKKDLYYPDDTWKKKQVTEAYQEQDGKWVKIAPSE